MSSSPSSHTEESQQQQQQQQQQSPRYWCYTCNSEVPIYMAPDPTCQRCNEQFIEEIDSENDPQSFLAGAPATNTSTADSQAQSENAGQTGDNQPHQAFFRYETGDDDDIFHFFAPMDGRPSTEGGLGSGGLGGTGGSDEPGNLNQQPLATMIQNLLTSMLGPAAEGMQQQQQQRSGGGDNEGTTTSGDQQPPTSTTGDREEGDNGTQSQRTPRRPTPVVFYGSMADGNMQFRPMNIPSQQNQGEGENQEGQGGDENRPPNNFANLFQLLSTLVGSSEGGFVGNPDDYVFSQTALDNIISQLMEQTSGRNAPPPAPETVIASLPKRKLTEEETAQQVDCAVCKDEFEKTEQVIELPCTHVFHEDCIKPWLKVNGTCPVCRHSVIGEKEESSNTDREERNTSPSPEQPSGQSSNAQAPPPPSPQNNNNQTPDPASAISSLLFEGARRMYNDRSPAATWHTTIPGPFTWGPGGRATNNPTTNNDNNNNSNSNSNDSTTNNNSSNDNNANDNNNTQQQSSADPNNTDPMDLDLD